uniref:Uncharacterized protein n=1 Tax=Romanomermis culicivorax TaxID=13658 RepID=A0A915L5H0_ROMCU
MGSDVGKKNLILIFLDCSNLERCQLGSNKILAPIWQCANSEPGKVQTWQGARFEPIKPLLKSGKVPTLKTLSDAAAVDVLETQALTAAAAAGDRRSLQESSSPQPPIVVDKWPKLPASPLQSSSPVTRNAGRLSSENADVCGGGEFLK